MTTRVNSGEARSVSLADGFALATARAHEAAVASFDKRVRRALEAAGLVDALLEPAE